MKVFRDIHWYTLNNTVKYLRDPFKISKLHIYWRAKTRLTHIIGYNNAVHVLLATILFMAFGLEIALFSV